MCGIVGILSLSGKPIPDAKERVGRMNRMLQHRGPDGDGVYLSPDRSLALGNTRLAIVDPATPVAQPMATRDGSFVLSFNGEIYNHSELRDQLRNKGIVFRTHTDTEVLLEGLRLEGEPFLEKLEGMWAFAFYDASRRQLLLSRDLMGERHLFFRQDKEELVFASEVKPLLADSKNIFEIDFDSFLTSLQYFAAPPGRSMVKGVQRLLAGHNMKILVGGDPAQYRFLKLKPEKWFGFFNQSPSFEKVSENFERLFHQACVQRLPQEVPYLCTLSGGLDSTLLCLYASEFGSRKIQTLYGQSSETAPCKNGDLLDEWAASRFTAAKLKTEHDHILLNREGFVPVLQALADNAFDGMFDNAVAAFEMLSRHAREKQAKVMLISEGADEMFGYPKDLDCPLVSETPFRFLPIHQSWEGEFLSAILTQDQLLSTSHYYGVEDPVYEHLKTELDFAQRRALSYASFSLPDMFNLRVDKAYMNSSVEARIPFESPSLVEFLIAIPSRFRFVQGKTTKYMLRRLVKRHIGKEISSRSKYGFAEPLWKENQVFGKMGYAETVAASPFFEKFPFKKEAREFVLHPKNKDMLWSFFVLAKTEAHLRERSY